jgi:hypothetical protein
MSELRQAIVKGFRAVQAPIVLIELCELLNFEVATMVYGEDFPLMDGGEGLLSFSIGDVRVELLAMIKDGIVEVHKDAAPSRDGFVMEDTYILK